MNDTAREDHSPEVAILVLMLIALLLGLFAPDPAHGQLRGPVRNLTADTTPASGDMLLIDKATPLVSRKLTLGTLATFIASLSGSVPSTRIINCTWPLLCAGTTSMDLSADRTLSLSPAQMVSTVNGGPVTWSTVGSTITGATNEGLRKSLFTLFDTRTDQTDGAILMIDQIQRTNPGATGIIRTGLHIKSYTQPDNGGETSGLLSVSTGGGNAATFYKIAQLRPTGYTDYSSSPQGALEVGTDDSTFAGLFSSGIGYAGSPSPHRSHAIEVRMGNLPGAHQSDGIIVATTTATTDDRLAFAIGNPQTDAAPVNVIAWIEADGDAFFRNMTLSSRPASASSLSLTNNVNDGTHNDIVFRKARAGLSVNTDDVIGDINWNFWNSTNVEKGAGLIRGQAVDKTSGSEDLDFHFWQMRAGTLTDNIVFRSTGGIEAVTGTFSGVLSASNFSGSHSGTSSGTNTGDQTITLTGDTTGSGTGSFATTLATAYKGWTDSGTTVNTTTSTDKVGIGTSSADSPLHITTNAAALPAPISGTLLHVGQVDSGTGAVFASDTFAAANTLACRRADGSNASPSALATNDVICNFAAYGYGTSAYGATPGAAIKLTADQTWTSSAQGGRIDLATADLNTAAGTTVKWSISAMGHLTSTQTTAPTVACTGTGTSPSAPTIDSGGTDHKWTVTMNTGTGSPGSTGTCTITFATAFPAARPVVCMLVKGASSWGNGSTIMETTESASAPVFTWTNIVSGTPTALTVSTSYKFSCVGGF